MEEKKLIDEEIVKALGCCSVSPIDCDSCPLSVATKDCGSLIGEALDLIRRLQYGYSSASKASEEWREKYEKECKENAEQKAEIERLKATVKRLELADECGRRMRALDMKENAELQKQGDEWKNYAERLFEENQDHYDKLQNANLYIEKHEPIWKRNTEQAVKDTAKEIFTDLLKEFLIRKSCGNADVVVREMATRKGVEVE